MKTEVRNLTRVFGKNTAVDNISFSFEDGNIFGFIGPNGAGKTTTIRIMATLDLATSGDVFYDGVSATLYPEAVRRVVGYMPDSLPGYKDIQVWEYLDFFARSFGLKGTGISTTSAPRRYAKSSCIRSGSMPGSSPSRSEATTLSMIIPITTFVICQITIHIIWAT